MVPKQLSKTPFKCSRHGGRAKTVLGLLSKATAAKGYGKQGCIHFMVATLRLTGPEINL